MSERRDAASTVRWHQRLGRPAKIVLGLAVSAVLLYFTVASVPSEGLFSALARADVRWIAFALLLIVVEDALKVYRWQTMMRSLGASVGFGQAAVPFMGCVALNNVLPLRAGDVVRVLGFRQTIKLGGSAQFGTLVLERLLDVGALLVLLLIAGLMAGGPPEANVGEAGILVFGVAAAILLIVTLPGLLRRGAHLIASRTHKIGTGAEVLVRVWGSIETLCKPALLARLVVLSFAAWLLEGGAFLAVGYSLGLSITPGIVLLAMVIGNLSMVIPSAPGYIGTFHFFTAGTLLAFDFSRVDSAAFAILTHGIVWATTTSVGLLLLVIAGLGNPRRLFAASENTLNRETRM